MAQNAGAGGYEVRNFGTSVSKRCHLQIWRHIFLGKIFGSPNFLGTNPQKILGQISSFQQQVPFVAAPKTVYLCCSKKLMKMSVKSQNIGSKGEITTWQTCITSDWLKKRNKSSPETHMAHGIFPWQSSKPSQWWHLLALLLVFGACGGL